MARDIHPSALIGKGVELGEDVHIGPQCIIGDGTIVADGTRIGPQATVGSGVVLGAYNEIGPKLHIADLVRIGDHNKIFGQASLGTAPQDLSYKGEPTRLEIGSHNTIREFVTINRGTIKGGGYTRVGSHCLLMACSHVAHDCEIHDHVILGNNVLLAGHVKVEERANVAGAAAAHHFVTVGTHAYVGGVTRMVQDVPPYMILEGHRPRVRGVNIIGLKRAGVGDSSVQALREVYKDVYRPRDKNQPKRALIDRVAEEFGGDPYVDYFVDSLRKTELGPKGRFRETLREQYAAAGRVAILGEEAGQ
ncbi:MAG: acyl-ACP--UDP-N-acetylglucosamine O-acyltransferase [Planctomycetota bacterium]|jgi:UDP-N-acetylglucosamine acyltransferase